MCQGKKAKAAARPKTYALHEDEDGWEGIQEAQNAAATRALFQVHAHHAAAAAEAAAVLCFALLLSQCYPYKAASQQWLAAEPNTGLLSCMLRQHRFVSLAAKMLSTYGSVYNCNFSEAMRHLWVAYNANVYSIMCSIIHSIYISGINAAWHLVCTEHLDVRYCCQVHLELL